MVHFYAEPCIFTIASTPSFYSSPDRGAEYCGDCVCLSVHAHYCRNYVTRPIVTKCFSCMLPMSMARSSTSGVAIRYVLPVLSMTSCLYTTVRNRRHSSNSVGIGMDLSPWRLLKLTHHGQHRTGAESDTRFSCISKCSPTSSSPRWFSEVERAPCTSSIRWATAQ